MPVPSRVRRLVDAARTIGAGRLAPSLLRWAMLREFVVFARDLVVPGPGEAWDPSLRWTDLSGSTAGLLMEIDHAFDEKEFGRLQREGQYCRLAWVGARLVHYRWDTTQPAYLPCLDAGTGHRAGTC